jgi:phospholipase/carboxylesterase
MPQDKTFIHKLERPANPDGTVLLLFHGSGGDETTVLPFGRELSPRAALLGFRGRSNDEGFPRYFRRLTMTDFDQAQIKEEAEVFARFLPDVLAKNGLDETQTTFVGYSNGGNFIGALLFLHPHLVRRAILLRSMRTLEHPPPADLTGCEVLMINGEDDPYSAFAPALEAQLTERGAAVAAHMVAYHHGLCDKDLELARSWLAERKNPAIG